jgi:predicted Zn-dependent protease
MINAEDEDTRENADVALAELFLAYSREDELLADKLGVKYAKLAGYDPNAMVSFLNKLKEIEKKEPIKQLNYARTHPYLSDRLATVRMEISGNMSYEDYLNKSQEFDKK